MMLLYLNMYRMLKFQFQAIWHIYYGEALVEPGTKTGLNLHFSPFLPLREQSLKSSDWPHKINYCCMYIDLYGKDTHIRFLVPNMHKDIKLCIQVNTQVPTQLRFFCNKQQATTNNGATDSAALQPFSHENGYFEQLKHAHNYT